MQTARTFMLVVFSLLLSTAAIPASGETAGSSAASQARLEQRLARLGTQLRGKTGAREHQELERQKREIDALQRRIAVGETVSPAEIDEVLREIPLR